jgi:hypothetical protein
MIHGPIGIGTGGLVHEGLKSIEFGVQIVDIMDDERFQSLRTLGKEKTEFDSPWGWLENDVCISIASCGGKNR